MDCPKCQTTLQPQTVAGVDVDRCPNCQGLWLDLGELEALLQQTLAAESLKPAGSAVYDALTGPCPRCGGQGHMTRLTSLRRADVVMDSCAVCYGIWLDGGELAKLAAAGEGDNLRAWIGRLLGQG